jgi:glycosyltransferase involved in cell wall biosynthesis
MSNGGHFEPIWLTEVEVGRSLPWLATQHGGRCYRRALCLVRLHGAPIGSVEIELGETGCSPAQLAETINHELDAAIADHLRRDGLLAEGLTAAGLPGAAGRRCRGDAQAREHGPFVSVVVPTCNRPDRLTRCLRSILACTYRPFEVIVVDNGSIGSETRDVVSRLQVERVRYVREERPGRSWARNRGLAEARGDIVAYADDDVVVDRYWLDAIVDAFSAADRVGCVTGLIMPFELETQAQLWLDQYGGFDKGYTRRVFDLRENRPSSPLYPYTAGTFGSGASMAFHANVLRGLGGFDVALGSGSPGCGGEELLAFFQVIDRGHTLVYEPAAIVRHPHHREYERVRRQVYSYGEGLSAYLTACVVDDPRRLFVFVAKAVTGIQYLLSPRSPKNRRKPVDYPPQLSRAELRGFLVGPLAYARGRVAARHIRRHQGTLELVLHSDPLPAGTA